MATIRTDYETLPWSPCTEMFGAAALYNGRPIIEAKTLTDRRAEGGGITYMLRFSPPEGKLIKVVARARRGEPLFRPPRGRRDKGGPAGRGGGRLFNQSKRPA